jgi:hypothetical protein
MLRATTPPLLRHLSLHLQSDDTCKGDCASLLPPFSYYFMIISHMFFFRGWGIDSCMHFAMCLFSFAHMILVFFSRICIICHSIWHLVCKLIVDGIMHVQVLAMKQWWANLCDLMQLEFEVDDTEQLIFDVLFHTRLKGRSNHESSWIGHSANVWWEQEFGHDYIWWDYFCDDLVNKDHFPKHCYKMCCIFFFCHIMDVMVAHYFYL